MKMIWKAINPTQLFYEDDMESFSTKKRKEI